jgi:hypothetical protein
MTNTFIGMSEEEFDSKYPLLKNHLNPQASWVYGDGPGCLFETYGEELDFVRQQDPATVWTLLDADDGGQYVVSGYHFVNRIGYLISTIPVPEGVDIEVRIPMQDDPAEDVPSACVQESGAMTCALPMPAPELPAPFDRYEIHGMKRLVRHGCKEEPVGPVIDDCEQVNDDAAEFWSLFGHIPGQGLDSIGDFATREHAEEVFARITGRPYTQPTRNRRSGQP